MSTTPIHQINTRSTVGEDYAPRNGPVSFLFEYTLDFGRENTIIISRLQEPSEIPRPADYLEVLPVAYYISVDPRFRLVLLTPTYDTVAAISFLSFQKPVFEVQELSEIFSAGSFSSEARKTFSGRSKGAKTRFSGDLANTITWAHQPKEDTFDLWVSEGLTEPLSPIRKSQIRKVGTMRRSRIAESDTKRIIIEANTSYISEISVLASALTVLKKDALQETQKKAMAARALSFPFISNSLHRIY
ncbi:hypothetical protein H072_1083 [Dactylellina haptotyla CBS 200.50]|uniref:Uncharacterized protein n=1 Tax=Dactylellina haptotyla (strain CBS 200.50) TaxID=1284197 RepID=S8BZQ6_DACHA|nr:hypothetical protein H072_1083 [Dactylellina haptotyla CBS 200.50]